MLILKNIFFSVTIGLLFFLINFFISQWLVWKSVMDPNVSHATLFVLNTLSYCLPVIIVCGLVCLLIFKKKEVIVEDREVSVFWSIFIAASRTFVFYLLFLFTIDIFVPYLDMIMSGRSFLVGFISILLFYFTLKSFKRKGIVGLKYQKVIHVLLFLFILIVVIFSLFSSFLTESKYDVYYSRKIDLIQPSANEIWEIGKTYTVKWKSEGMKSDEDIVIGYRRWDDPFSGSYYPFTDNIVKNTGEYDITVPYNTVTDKGGLFQIIVYSLFKSDIPVDGLYSGTTKVSLDAGLAQSATDVQIVNPMNKPPTPTDLKVNGLDGPISVKYDSVITVSWNIEKSAVCYPSGTSIPSVKKDPYTGDPNYAWEEGYVIMNLPGTKPEIKYIARDYKIGFVPVIYLNLSCDNGNGYITKDSVQINLVR